jgi:hypothetical protein
MLWLVGDGWCAVSMEFDRSANVRTKRVVMDRADKGGLDGVVLTTLG